MFNYLELLMKYLLVENSKKCGKNDCDDEITPKRLTVEYRKILDKLATKMAVDAFENQDILRAILSLARIERIVIVFNIIQELQLSEIASMLDTTVDSVYTQKHTALKRLKEELEKIDDT